jgi:hypothetical protein
MLHKNEIFFLNSKNVLDKQGKRGSQDITIQEMRIKSQTFQFIAIIHW